MPFFLSPEFNTKDGFERLVRFLSEVVGIISKYLKSGRDSKTKVLDFHHPHQLREIMDHCLNVDENPRDLEQVLSDCKETLKYCVKTGTKRNIRLFINLPLFLLVDKQTNSFTIPNVLYTLITYIACFIKT